MTKQNYYQEDIETMSREEMKKLQSQKLVKQVKHVYDNVPYYRELMEKQGVTPDDIKSIDIDGNQINVEIDDTLLKTNETVLCSDSAGGWRSKIREVTPVESDFQVDVHELIARIEELKNNAEIWQATGGTHVAGIVYKDQFIVKEDVSRHVAVDKVIGYGILHGFDLIHSYVIYSGRMPADMVIKMTRSGVPILASNAAPANSGYNIAKKGNITLVGFLRGQRCNIYNNQNRILF